MFSQMTQRVLHEQKTAISLPSIAVAKLKAMRSARDVYFAASRAAAEKIIAEKKVLDALETELVKNKTADGPVDYYRRRAATEETEKAIAIQKAKIGDLNSARNAISDHGAGSLLTAIEAWIEENKRADFRSQPGTKPKFKTGENLADVVDRLRQKLDNLRADRHAVFSAQIPASEAKAALRREIDALAERGAPDATQLLEGGSLRWPVNSLRVVAGSVLQNQQADVATLVWLHRDLLITRLESQIEDIADPGEALTKTQRAEADARLVAEILATEREEEAIIVAAAAQGVVIHRRIDADPRALLELADNVPGYSDEI